jgi:hypothetical protein
MRTACEWNGPSQERYVPLLLSHPDELGLALTGIAVLRLEPGAQFVYPSGFAAELSRATAAAGDVSAVVYV